MSKRKKFLFGNKKRRAVKAPRTTGSSVGSSLLSTKTNTSSLPTEAECAERLQKIAGEPNPAQIAARINMLLILLKNKLPESRLEWVDPDSWADLIERKEKKTLTNVSYTATCSSGKITIRMPEVYLSIAVASACKGSNSVKPSVRRTRLDWCRKIGEIGELGRISAGPCLLDASDKIYTVGEESYISFNLPIFVIRDPTYLYFASKNRIQDQFVSQLLQRTIFYYISQEDYRFVKLRGSVSCSFLKITPLMSFAEALHKAGEETLDFYDTEIAIMESANASSKQSTKET